MLEQNKELVRRYYREVTGGLWGIEEVVSADFVDHHFPPGMPPGPAGVRKFFGEVLGGIFRDVRRPTADELTWEMIEKAKKAKLKEKIEAVLAK